MENIIILVIVILVIIICYILQTTAVSSTEEVKIPKKQIETENPYQPTWSPCRLNSDCAPTDLCFNHVCVPRPMSYLEKKATDYKDNRPKLNHHLMLYTHSKKFIIINWALSKCRSICSFNRSLIAVLSHKTIYLVGPTDAEISTMKIEKIKLDLEIAKIASYHGKLYGLYDRSLYQIMTDGYCRAVKFGHIDADRIIDLWSTDHQMMIKSDQGIISMNRHKWISIFPKGNQVDPRKGGREVEKIINDDGHQLVVTHDEIVYNYLYHRVKIDNKYSDVTLYQKNMIMVDSNHDLIRYDPLTKKRTVIGENIDRVFSANGRLWSISTVTRI